MNENTTQFALVDTTKLEWTPSPAAGVWRKRCYLDGSKEKGAVTSVVRYDEGSVFPTHEHPEGEELFVLEGVFSDAHGDHPAGTFVLNPPGSSHAPRSEDGCKLFVRLRQYDGTERVCIDTHDESLWTPHIIYDGINVLELRVDEDWSYTMMRLAAGARVEEIDVPHGKEIFVVDGHLQDGDHSLAAGAWVRYAPGSTHSLRAFEGATLLVRNRLRSQIQAIPA